MNRFYPSRRAVLVAALGVPLGLLAGIAAPALWTAGPLWSLCVLALMLLDALLGAGRLTVASQLPASMGLGRAAPALFTLAFRRAPPASTEVELEGNGRFTITPHRLALKGGASAAFYLNPLRRGEGRLEKLWLRWTGPLGLAWVQRSETLNRSIPILPDIQSVREEAMLLFQREEGGLNTQLNLGAGTEFHALREFQAGHDPRQIDWKQSARHRGLMVREFRAEQNQHIVAMLDTGRLMSEPLSGQPRLDRALHAILLLFYAALKLGDQVGFAAFDSRPRLFSGPVRGLGAFSHLQHLAAQLDYSAEESNFTLALTQFSAQLERRSVIFIFTDFADSTGAELMLENIPRLLQRHTVLFVLFRDAELDAMRRAEPFSPRDATRTVIADMMDKEREVVLERLRRMGVRIVDVPLERMGAGVLNAYLAHKQRILL